MLTIITVNDRLYNSYSFDNVKANVINPIESKLFNQDSFLFDQESRQITNLVSPTRTCQYMTGILILEDNKTFGRTKNKKRLLYKCVPDDKYLPNFLVPYDINIGFTKKMKNRFILFRFDEWDSNTHPIGIIIENIGDVDNSDSFYEYQLYSRFLHTSIKKMTQEIKNKLKLPKNTPKIQSQNEDFIFSIDPKNTVDFDDAFSFNKNEENYCIKVYLPDVVTVIELMDLWDAFSDRVSTIYLPNKRLTMLPSLLSELCSLKEKENRHVFVLEYYFDFLGNPLSDKTIMKKDIVHINKNFVYEEQSMLKNDNYNSLFDFTKKIDNTVENSHDVVTFWMIHTNTFCANYMILNKIGIFKTLNSPNKVHYNTDNKIQNFIQHWNNSSGSYVEYDKITENVENPYIHFTSPIRRLVDLLNHIIIVKQMSSISSNADLFLVKWMNKLDYINKSMKSIRKVQNECLIIHSCTHNIDDYHEGYVFNKTESDDHLFSYMVFLDKLNIVSRVTKSSVDVDNSSKHVFKLLLFENKDQIKKKIRLMFV
jgi:exoribonuclease R